MNNSCIPWLYMLKMDHLYAYPFYFAYRNYAQTSVKMAERNGHLLSKRKVWVANIRKIHAPIPGISIHCIAKKAL